MGNFKLHRWPWMFTSAIYSIRRATNLTSHDQNVFADLDQTLRPAASGVQHADELAGRNRPRDGRSTRRSSGTKAKLHLDETYFSSTKTGCFFCRPDERRSYLLSAFRYTEVE